MPDLLRSVDAVGSFPGLTWTADPKPATSAVTSTRTKFFNDLQTRGERFKTIEVIEDIAFGGSDWIKIGCDL